MLSILLINDNKIVSRLFQLSSQKHNYNLEEVDSYSAKESAYNVLFVDSKVYDEEKLNELKDKVVFDKLTYLGDKGTQMPDGFDLMLEKPFLPTDFVNLMNENFKIITPEEEKKLQEESHEELDELDLDSLEEIEEIDIDNELNLEVENDLTHQKEDIDIEKNDKELLVNGNSKEDLADMVAEIDELDESIEEIETKKEDDTTVNEITESSDEIKDEKKSDEFADIDSLEDKSIVSEDLVQESIQEVEKLDVEDNEQTTNTALMTSAAIASAATALAMENQDQINQENNIEPINILDKDLDSLNVDDIKDALGEDSSIEKEIVVNENIQEELQEEQILQDVEKQVQPNELEEIIAKAVSKALTKELIHEALKDMDIVISLKPKEDL